MSGLLAVNVLKSEISGRSYARYSRSSRPDFEN